MRPQKALCDLLGIPNFNPRTPGRVRRVSSNQLRQKYRNFNPRTPGRVRRDEYIEFSSNFDFNPRTPGRVRPAGETEVETYQKISIHAPRVGCDLYIPSAYQSLPNFNPRTPGRVRQQKCIKSKMAFMFFCAYFSICV